MTKPRMTPTRLACLRVIKEFPGILAPYLVDRAVPRPTTSAGRPLHWSAQGAARMGGKLAADLERLGWVSVNRYVRCGVCALELTHAGQVALAEAEAAGAPT